MATLLIGSATTGLSNPKFTLRRLSDGFYWSTVAVDFAAYNATDIANYGIVATETGATGDYTATNPAETTLCIFVLIAAAGASLAVSDLNNNSVYDGLSGPFVATVDLSTIPGAVWANDITVGGGGPNAAKSYLIAVRAKTDNLPTDPADQSLIIAATNAITTDLATKPTLAEILAGGDVDGFTLEQTLKLCLSALAGKLSGAGTTTITIRAADDSKNRITATVDSDGNRSAVTLDAAG